MTLLAAREQYRENPHYSKLPKLNEESIRNIINKEDESIYNRYALYLYARQTGKWLSLIYDKPIKYLLLNYSLRIFDNKDYPPVFFTHSFNDPDVPCQESKAIHELLPRSELFLVASDEHDFERFEEKSITNELLKKSIHFLDTTLNV